MMEQITKRLAADLLPKRKADGHKGSFGKVCVIGGSVGYTGAPVYAAEAATRSGSGLVFLGTPGAVYPIV
ncbi:MAG: bifunctional ADP-dependent NAD(P)H-hydrate dehydratase/NAD(P)H-hydrate epimerase, partial [Clostridia bacterium]|nr:bifunctional ADP-dependent NAD(P)H-hydrate dehydratase/NAD(P)H-hydrate epimerase [Clostridia bacterium]